ncbi:DUF742 domain-containing protein [Nocardia alba]|uniref:Uncharacterized protein DUF742 n=1 Tax=Nocardia alba TaxID=225051 RepID=A0A4R1FBQ4_9NOCA|nr:DUF742 domain-containing protein [Nocardia alba]TCJ90214.1 uncharacterized protein DUF742 [Nocardia alba]
MSDDREHWYEDEAGPMVRLYAVTGGRSKAPRHDLELTTLLVDARSGMRSRLIAPEYDMIVTLCRTPLSVAEVSAHLRLPLTSTKLLIGDLIDEGRLHARAPRNQTSTAPDIDVLRAVLAGIKRS